VPQRKQKRASGNRQWFADEASEDNEDLRLHKLSDVQSDPSPIRQMIETSTNSDISQTKKGT
jgi:hypothetical protein